MNSGFSFTIPEEKFVSGQTFIYHGYEISLSSTNLCCVPHTHKVAVSGPEGHINMNVIDGVLHITMFPFNDEKRTIRHSYPLQYIHMIKLTYMPISSGF